MGDRLAHLQSVLDAFGKRVERVSGVYSTAPWGGVDQDDFLNAVVIVDDPDTSCRGWLKRGQELENTAGRVRETHWGPRTLDVDVITCGFRSEDPELILPHPRAHERAFVLRPWLDVEPDAVLDVDGELHDVAQLLAGLDAAERNGVVRTDFVLEMRSMP
jgi:2-amino-4-hydroxy-6-hydroxymethyldihydropteridine diphosphokinase